MDYSVLMSIYYKEQPEFFRAAVESMLHQTVPPTDFVIVCDGPLTEELDRVVEEFHTKFPKLFQIIRRKTNQGLGLALQEGLTYCKEELVARMGAEGHQIGNHTWSHQRLETASTETITNEIARTDQAIGSILGGSGYWLRLPYGLLPEEARAQISVPVIKWSVDPRDWESREKWAVVNAVMEAVQPGSIILLHDIYPASVEAALEIVDRLQAQGYWFVTVEELLRIQGTDVRPGVLYRSAASWRTL